MKEEAAESAKKINYEKFVVRKSLEEYWRADEKLQLVMLGLGTQIPITTLCKLNNVSPSLFYEWREKFIANGREGLMGNSGRSRREQDLEQKIEVLERCIGELTLERELLKKLQG